MGNPITDAKNRYNVKNYDIIAIRQPKGWREEAKSAAGAAGKSLAGYIREAVEEKMTTSLKSFGRNKGRNQK